MEKVKCRETDRCRSKVWYIENKPWTFNQSSKELVEHVCSTYVKSAFPDTIYVGVWKNTKTNAVRYSSLQKKEDNARKPPDNYGPWVLLHVLSAVPKWEELKDKTTTYYASSNYGELGRRT